MRRPIILTSLLLLCGGCVTETEPVPRGPDVVFIVPGVGGPSGYGALIDALQRPNRSIEMVSWGAPPPLFFLNFSDKNIHDDAEKQFAEMISKWRRDHPGGRIDVIGHSAGCGVALGAIAMLTETRVHHLILLCPSVSPSYDLRPALARIYSQVHVFTSRQDSLLEWRTRTFASYDRISGPAAGVGGFSGDFSSQKVIQHEFTDSWRSLGHDGGHWGPLADQFSRRMIAPLLEND